MPTEDDLHLQAYESKLQLVRDYVRGVALGSAMGFFLFGTGGIAKSYTVIGELQRLAIDFKLFNSRMSGRGLFDALGEYPNAVHGPRRYGADCQGQGWQGIIRSACLGTAGGRWTAKANHYLGQQQEAWRASCFKGGLIMLSNRALDDLPELKANQDRISHLHLEVSDRKLQPKCGGLPSRATGMAIRK